MAIEKIRARLLRVTSVLNAAMIPMTIGLFALFASSFCWLDLAASPEIVSRERHFEFTYEFVVNDLKPNARVQVWIPLPRNDRYQQVSIVNQELPGEATRSHDKEFGNEMMYLDFRAAADTASIKLRYRVLRSEIQGLRQPAHVELIGDNRKLYLAADQLVPIEGKPIELFNQYLATSNASQLESPLEKAKRFYAWVLKHMTYDKSLPGYGRGDVNWACQSQRGNCTDFHSLFISLARNRGVPARFEMGFSLPPARGSGEIAGYHCWAQFFNQSAWVPVDIAEADKNPELRDYYFGNLSADRIHFTTGRDIDLNPESASGPLNFFIYPHVEVDGVVWPDKKVVLHFGYQDIR